MSEKSESNAVVHEGLETGCTCEPMEGTFTALVINLACPLHGNCPDCGSSLLDHPCNGCWD